MIEQAEQSKEERIKTFARDEAGFDAVGITTSDPPGHAEQTRAWLDAGMHGRMAYLEKRAALRAGPLSSPNLLDGARSVIVVGVSYAPVGEGEDAPPAPNNGGASDTEGRAIPGSVLAPPLLGAGGASSPRGVVARYARGRDYHHVLWEKLNRLGAFIEREWPGEKTRSFTDSGPIRERELAARAGLGWQGKHTNLISLDLGNWFFLGALLTTLDLAPDAPLDSGHCGTCTRCLAACPTGAIVAPLTLDARRCISYLTIELKGPMPRELRPLVGNRIFGCDDCLAACPWNERAQTSRELQFQARSADAARPDLLEWLDLLADETTFKAKFAETPLLRTGREGLRRNVCIALGNEGGANAISDLKGVLETDPSPVVRGAAAWALGRIGARTGSRAAHAYLVRAATGEADAEVSEEIAQARAEAEAGRADGDATAG